MSYLPPECALSVLGSFECTSGKLFVTDPCYPKTIIHRGTIAVSLDNARMGTWWAFMRRNLKHPDRAAELVIMHESLCPAADEDQYELPMMQRYDADGYCGIGVDTGQAGFFDETGYPQGDQTGDHDDRSTFYGMCCFITCETLPQAGIIAASPTRGCGVVSTAGWGDGIYDLYTARNFDDELIAARLKTRCEIDLTEKIK